MDFSTKEEALLMDFLKSMYSQAYQMYTWESFEDEKKNEAHQYHVKKITEQYMKTWALLWNNLLLVKWFWTHLWAKFENKNYEKKIKKADTLPLFFQHYSPWNVVYFNSLTYTLRSKKNNRPIFMNYWKLNSGAVYSIQKACNAYLSPAIPLNQRRAMITKSIMSCTMIWKDQELVEQEKMLTNIYKSYKNTIFWVAVKNYWDVKTMFNLLWDSFLTHELIEILKKNPSLKKEIQAVLKDKATHMRTLNLFFDTLEQAQQAELFFSKAWYEVEVLWNATFSIMFEHYLKTYIFFEEHMLSWIKSQGLWLTDLYKWNAFDWYRYKQFDEDCFNLDLIEIVQKYDKKLVKDLYKRLYNWFDFSYREDVFNSFLTQTDLSNSLELCQDVYQSFLRDLGISFDDMYINKIDASMLREPKAKKENCVFKNINWVGLKKIQ